MGFLHCGFSDALACLSLCCAMLFTFCHIFVRRWLVIIKLECSGGAHVVLGPVWVDLAGFYIQQKPLGGLV